MVITLYITTYYLKNCKLMCYSKRALFSQTKLKPSCLSLDLHNFYLDFTVHRIPWRKVLVELKAEMKFSNALLKEKLLGNNMFRLGFFH